ncbi:hypothetical protein Pelo_13204 [Pelomyxa schiedti]|nr:hypothetical protein Pelo_13204 [Pelomyxa schiedti]
MTSSEEQRRTLQGLFPVASESLIVDVLNQAGGDLEAGVEKMLQLHQGISTPHLDEPHPTLPSLATPLTTPPSSITKEVPVKPVMTIPPPPPPAVFSFTPLETPNLILPSIHTSAATTTPLPSFTLPAPLLTTPPSMPTTTETPESLDPSAVDVESMKRRIMDQQQEIETLMYIIHEAESTPELRQRLNAWLVDARANLAWLQQHSADYVPPIKSALGACRDKVEETTLVQHLLLKFAQSRRPAHPTTTPTTPPPPVVPTQLEQAENTTVSHSHS